MQILGFQKTTLLDYPGHVAATVFTGGCNFRCPFCHNGDLVLHPQELPAFTTDEIFAHLKKDRAYWMAYASPVVSRPFNRI